MVYDLIVVGVLLIALWRGAAKGMAWQLASIASLVLCFLFATPLSVPVAQMIKVDPPLNRWIAMLGIYVVFSLVCFGIARGIRSWLEKAKFVEFDRHLGAMFGLLKGAVFCFVLTFFLVCMSDAMADYILKTRTGYVSAILMQRLHVVMPAEVADIVRPYLKNLPAVPPEFNGLPPEQDQFADNEREPGRGEAPNRNKYRPKSEFRGSSRPAETGSRIPQAEKLPERLKPAAGERTLSFDNLVDQLSGLVGDKVQNAVSDTVRDVLPRPEPPEPRPSQGPAPADLLNRISAIFSSDPALQKSLKADVIVSLKDVPRDPALAALEDWLGDLMGQTPDIDPGTDVTTGLDQRLSRQIQAAGIAPEQLPAALRQRLELQ